MALRQGWALAGTLAMIFTAACATPNRLVAVPAPAGNQLGKAEFADVALVLRQFKFNGASEKEVRQEGPQMRAAFLNYLKERNTFASIVDSAQQSPSLSPRSLILDVEIDSAYTSNRTYILDYAFWFLLGLVSPVWGETKVTTRISAVDHTMRPLIVDQDSEVGEYSMNVFGWYRTGPQEKSFAQAYARAFDALAQKIATHRDVVLTAMNGGATMPSVASNVAQLQCRSGTPRRSVAVLPLQVKRVEAELGSILEDLLVSNVAAADCLKVISAADINAMLGLEKMKDALACSEASCAAEIGGALGVDLLLSGSVGRLGDNLMLSLTLIETGKSEVVGRFTTTIPNQEDKMPAYFRQAVRALFSKVPGVVS